MLELKQKLKLVAIEEEITKLQLQICRESNVYLGAKTEDKKEEEAEKFITDVIEPSVQNTYTFDRLTYANLKLLFADAQPITPKTKTVSWARGLSNTAKSLSKTLNMFTGYTIHKAVHTTRDGNQVYILIAFNNTPNSELGIHIATQDTLKTTTESDLGFTPMWADPAHISEESLKALKETFFNEHFSPFIEKLTPKTIKTADELQQITDTKAAHAAADLEIRRKKAETEAEKAAADLEIRTKKAEAEAEKATADIEIKRNKAAAEAEKAAADLEIKKNKAAAEAETAKSTMEERKAKAAADLEIRQQNEALNKMKQEQEAAANTQAKKAKIDAQIAELETKKLEEQEKAAAEARMKAENKAQKAKIDKEIAELEAKKQAEQRKAETQTKTTGNVKATTTQTAPSKGGSVSQQHGKDQQTAAAQTAAKAAADKIAKAVADKAAAAKAVADKIARAAAAKAEADKVARAAAAKAEADKVARAAAAKADADKARTAAAKAEADKVARTAAAKAAADKIAKAAAAKAAADKIAKAAAANAATKQKHK